MVTSKSINALAALLILSLSGCTTLNQHPVLTAIGAAILAGSVAAIAQRHHDQMHDRQIAPGGSPECRNGMCPP